MAYQISPTLATAIRNGAITAPVVELYVAGDRKATLSVTNLETTYDGSAAIPMACSMTLAGFEAIIPDLGVLQYASTYGDTNGTYGGGPGVLTYGDNLNRQIRGLVIPGVTELRIFDRVTLPDRTVQSIPAGRFRVDTASFNHTSKGVEVSVTGLDVSRRITMAGYTTPYNIYRGTNVRGALAALLSSVVPGITLTAPQTTFTTPRLCFLPVEGADPWADAKKIAYSAGWELTTDRNGGVLAFVPADPGTGTAVWDVTEAHLVSVGTSLDDATAVNTIVVNGETAEDKPVRGVAQMLTGQWGVNSIGRRTKYETVEHVNSVAQANAYATGILRRDMGLTDTIEVEVPFLPHLDQWDLVDVTDTTLELEDTTYRVVRASTDRASFSTKLTLARRLA